MPTYMTIEYNTATIDVLFNDLENVPEVGMKRWIMQRGFIQDVQRYADGSVVITTDRGQTHSVCSVLDLIADALPIQSINGETATDNDDLLTKLKGLL